MRYPKLRELREAIKALIKGPYTSKFPFQAHTPYERFRGKSEFQEEDCVGCAACSEVCPAQAIEVKDEGNKRFLTLRWDLCIFCGQCQLNCLTEKGIKLSPTEFDLATTEGRNNLKQTIEKELLLCECCSEVIAPLEQVLWVAKKLGPLCFSNASLMLFYLETLSPAPKKEPAKKEEREFLRADRIKVLCPRCRRETVVKS